MTIRKSEIVIRLKRNVVESHAKIDCGNLSSLLTEAEQSRDLNQKPERYFKALTCCTRTLNLYEYENEMV
jgi:hypothetical protein